jgi:hypothetical protein
LNSIFDHNESLHFFRVSAGELSPKIGRHYFVRSELPANFAIHLLQDSADKSPGSTKLSTTCFIIVNLSKKLDKGRRRHCCDPSRCGCDWGEVAEERSSIDLNDDGGED